MDTQVIFWFLSVTISIWVVSFPAIIIGSGIYMTLISIAYRMAHDPIPNGVKFAFVTGIGAKEHDLTNYHIPAFLKVWLQMNPVRVYLVAMIVISLVVIAIARRLVALFGAQDFIAATMFWALEFDESLGTDIISNEREAAKAEMIAKNKAMSQLRREHDAYRLFKQQTLSMIEFAKSNQWSLNQVSLNIKEFQARLDKVVKSGSKGDKQPKDQSNGGRDGHGKDQRQNHNNQHNANQHDNGNHEDRRRRVGESKADYKRRMQEMENVPAWNNGWSEAEEGDEPLAVEGY